jgi:hypothetical protein
MCWHTKHGELWCTISVCVALTVYLHLSRPKERLLMFITCEQILHGSPHVYAWAFLSVTM